jgi:hypothetical protein
MKTLLLLVFGLTMFVAPAQTPAELSGKWSSEKVEYLGNAFGHRVFTFKKTTWEIRFTMFSDEAMKAPLFTFRATGKYEISSQPGKAEGSKQAVFHFAKKYLTVKTDNQDALKNLGFADCKLTKDVEKEITDSGCSFLVSKAVCAQEFDLVAIKDGKLFLGSRPADGNMCTEEKRPTSLGEALVRK